MTLPTDDLLPLRQPQGCADLFRVFTRLALQGFGGVLPVAQRELVERERWLDRGQFLDLLATAQVLPGPNVVNLSLMVGDRWFGWRGALAAMAGMLAAPLLVVLALAVAVGQLDEVPQVAGALRGMGIVAAGLVLGTAIKLAVALRGSALGLPLAGGIVALTVAAVGALRWPLAYVVLGLGGASCVLAWWRLGRSAGAAQGPRP